MTQNRLLIVSTICAAILLSSFSGTAYCADVIPVPGEIAFYDLDRLVNEYDMANDLISEMEKRIGNIEAEVSRRGNKLQKDLDSYKEKWNKGLMSREIAEVQGNKLQEMKESFSAYKQQKELEIAEERAVVMNQIYEAISKCLKKYNEKHHYLMIVATTSHSYGGLLSVPISAADTSIDITDNLLEELNVEYLKAKQNQQ
jgi:Skp family chaperone for outer membrane proteins